MFLKNLPTCHIGLGLSPAVITHGAKPLVPVDGVHVALIWRVAITKELNSVEVRRWCRFSGWGCWRDNWCWCRRSSCRSRLFHTNWWTNLTGLVTSKVFMFENAFVLVFSSLFSPLRYPHVVILVVHASTVIILENGIKEIPFRVDELVCFK